MKAFTSTHTVAYSETDQMGIVHHSNYVKYYENARWQWFALEGVPYSKIESSGFILPVVHVDIQYVKPAYYDETLLIETSIEKTAGPKMVFVNKIFNSEGELINKGRITVAFVDKDSRKPCRPPLAIAEKIKQMMQEKVPALAAI